MAPYSDFHPDNVCETIHNGGGDQTGAKMIKFKALFGEQKGKVQVSKADKAHNNLDGTRRQLQLEVESLHRGISRKETDARDWFKRNNRPHARQSLRMKKRLEERLGQKQGALDKICSIKLGLEKCSHQ